LSPNQIEIEGWPKRVFAVGCAGDGFARLAKDRVVQGDAKRTGGSAECLDLLSDLAEYHILVDSILGVEGVMSRPVLELLAKEGDERGNGVAARANQMGEQMLSESARAGWG